MKIKNKKINDSKFFVFFVFSVFFFFFFLLLNLQEILENYCFLLKCELRYFNILFPFHLIQSYPSFSPFYISIFVSKFIINEKNVPMHTCILTSNNLKTSLSTNQTKSIQSN